MSKIDFNAIYNEADAAGDAAAKANVPVPMVVTQGADMLDDNSPVVKSWYVEDGACGFAWVKVYPGNSPFANWLKKNKGLSKAYGGGVDVWVSKFGQSISRKEAYAGAFASVLKKYGIQAYSDSRLD